jgi:acyl-coenzyme A synthetase/AMP-(fatty) acid ligase
MTILEMISKAIPGASAIEDVNGGKMTYGQLKANAHKVVGFLNNAGFKKTDRIAIIMPNGLQLAVTLVSVASGFTVMPINPDYKAPEFENYLLALHPRALLTKAGTMSWQLETARNLGLETLELIPNGGNEEGAFSLGGPDKSDLV